MGKCWNQERITMPHQHTYGDYKKEYISRGGVDTGVEFRYCDCGVREIHPKYQVKDNMEDKLVKNAWQPLTEDIRFEADFPEVPQIPPTPKVTRVEVIDYTMAGNWTRAYSKQDENILVEIELQDNEKTLKIFITPRE